MIELGGGLIGLLALILFIVALISILGSGLSTGMKIVWVLVVLLLPIIGAILWFLIGKKAGV
jgi:hypothetical protein